MKRRKKLRGTAALGAEFAKGCLASGLLAAIQNQGGKPVLDRRTARLALQGGSALTAGAALVRVLDGEPLSSQLPIIALGALAILATERFLGDSAAEALPDTPVPLSGDIES